MTLPVFSNLNHLSNFEMDYRSFPTIASNSQHLKNLVEIKKNLIAMKLN